MPETAPVIRRAEPGDIPALVDLVYGPAEYEQARRECTLTAEQLHTALFGPHPAVFAHGTRRPSACINPWAPAPKTTGWATGCPVRR